MLTSDPSKDYYAALETSPTCGEDELKKQYRKLALLYHPDRNAGKEAEYNPRFQIIQEAYEVLSNPEQRIKYDLKRKRGVAGPSPTQRPEAPRRNNMGNPYQATSDFPPPPRRTGPQRTEVPPTARAGANMYTQWTAPPAPPRRERTSAGKDAAERKNMFDAWQSMNSAQRTPRPPPNPPTSNQQQQRYRVPPPYQTGQQRPVPPPPSTPNPAAADLRPTSNPTHHRATSSQDGPRSAYEELHRPAGINRTTSTHVPNKSGFDPSNVVGTDEAPNVNGPSLYRTATGFGATSTRLPQEPPRSTPTTKRPSLDTVEELRPQSSEDVPFAEGTPKEKTPYLSRTGERTTLDKDGYFNLRRVSSVHDAPQFFKPTSGQAERRRSEAAPSEQTPPKPTFNFAVPTPTPPASPDPPLGQAGHYSNSPDKANASNGSDESEYDGPILQNVTSHKSTASSTSGFGRTISREYAQQNATSPPKSSMRHDDASRARDGPGVRFSHVPGVKEPTYRSSNPDMRSPSRDSAAGTSTSGRPGSAGSNGGPIRSTSYPDVSRVASQEIYSDDEAEDGPRGKSTAKAAGAQNSQGTDGSEFRRSHWEDELRNSNWAERWANPSNIRTSPTRPRIDPRSSASSTARTNHRGYSGDKPLTPQPTSLAQEEEGPVSPRPPQDADDIDPMDIDTEPVIGDRRPSVVVEDVDEPQRPARPVHVPPAREDWSSLSANGTSYHDQHRRSSLPDFSPIGGPPVSSQQPNLAQSRPTSRAAEASPAFNFKDFKHVQPFGGAAGINGPSSAPFNNMRDDLVTSLPFTSQASRAHPTAPLTDHPALQNLPCPPAPIPSPTAMAQEYFGRVFAYIQEYHRFQAEMLARMHYLSVEQAKFTGPNSSSATNPQSQKGTVGGGQPLTAPGIMPFWISQRGETAGLKGFDSYMRLLAAQEKLQKHLNVGTEKFAMTMEKHNQLRARALEQSDIAARDAAKAPPLPTSRPPRMS